MFVRKSKHEKLTAELNTRIKKLEAENKALAFKLAQYKAKFKKEN